MSEEWDGLLLVDKPAGPTSHDVVALVRSVTGLRRVGHTGTLDPPATGLLVLVLGCATRLAPYVFDDPKTYGGVLTLGLTTTTDDLSGEILSRHDGALPAPEVVASTAALRLGRQRQIPPAFSARHVGGTRMYRLARRGVTVEAPAAEVVVLKLELTPTETPERWSYEIVVSSGTYVRAVVRDLGRALGCGAAVASLRRTNIGPMSVHDALTLSTDRGTLRDAIRRRLVPLDAMPLDLPSIALPTASDAKRFVAGGRVSIVEEHALVSALAAVHDDGGRLLGVGLSGEGTLRPRMVLARS